MIPKIFCLLVSFFLLVILVSCNHKPDCSNSNELFIKYSPKDTEYKDELVIQLENIDKNKLRYWVKEYAERGNEEFIYFDIQGDGLCAIIEINMTIEKHDLLTNSLYNGVESKHNDIGSTRTSIEFFDLEFDILQDSLQTEFIFRDFRRHSFD